jgi:hypothetical protein
MLHSINRLTSKLSPVQKVAISVGCAGALIGASLCLPMLLRPAAPDLSGPFAATTRVHQVRTPFRLDEPTEYQAANEQDILQKPLNVNGQPPLPPGVAIVSWDASEKPDLAGYKLYYGPSVNEMKQAVKINNGRAAGYVLRDLPSGYVCVAASAFNYAGVDSAKSDPGCKVVR